MFKPDEKPVFHPNKTTLQWYLEDYPTIRKEVCRSDCVNLLTVFLKQSFSTIKVGPNIVLRND